MGLVLTEDQQMLKETAKGFIADAAPVDEFRKLRDAGEGYDAELWRQMAELGWSAVAVPEAYDGLEFGITGLGLIAVETGRHLVASPLSTTAAIGASALVLGQSEQARQRVLPEIATGQTLIALAVDENNHHDPLYTNAKAVAEDGGCTLDGSKVFVAEGNYADLFVVVARNDAGEFVLLLVDANAPGVTKIPVHLMDSRDYANVEFSGVRVPADDILADGDDAEAIVQTLIDIATVMAACELYGIAQEAFEQTVQYLTEREQFGQVIGTFQALQHRAAHEFAQLQLLKSVILDALDAAERKRPDLAIAASHAKALANEVAQLITNEAIQMHGGIGVTDELDIGLYFKRVRTLRNAYGLSSYHRRRFARLSGY
jgi:alkylation response protein AidB-like acyl-CoA dehydrogenase